MRERSEADRLAEERLELMPRAVRDKLDRVGFKVHLKDWQALPLADRERLRDTPGDTPAAVAAYRALVTDLMVRLTGQPPEPLRPGVPRPD